MSKLLSIQAELKAPKNQRNSFGNYNYRSAEDILEAVKPLLVSNNCDLTLSDEIVEIGGRIYVKATARFSDGAKETVVSAYAREAEIKKGMDDSQITGTASSYARKYALNGLFLIDDTKDADSDEYCKETSKNKPVKIKDENQKNNGLNFAELWSKYKSMNIEELRKEYKEVEAYPGWTDNQKKVVFDIIKKCSEGKE